MKKKRHVMDIYLGGERDPEDLTIPKRFEYFFDKKWLFLTLIVLILLLVISQIKIW